MDKDIFTEDMTVDEFTAKVGELDTPEKREEAALSFVRVLASKLFNSREWEIVDIPLN